MLGVFSLVDQSLDSEDATCPITTPRRGVVRSAQGFLGLSRWSELEVMRKAEAPNLDWETTNQPIANRQSPIANPQFGNLIRSFALALSPRRIILQPPLLSLPPPGGGDSLPRMDRPDRGV
jgi:hypothetical protein